MHDPKNKETGRDEESTPSSTGRAYEELVSSLFTVEQDTSSEEDDEEK